MATPKVQIDNQKLMKKMSLYQEVTGKQVAATMRRGARLLAVNLSYSTPPFGKNSEAQKQGEIAVQNDILRAYMPAAPIATKHPREKQSLRDVVKRVVVRDFKLRDAILAAIDMGNRMPNKRTPQKRITKKSRTLGIADLRVLLQQAEGFRKLKVDETVDTSIHKQTRNNYGRVRKGWKTRNVVYKSKDLEKYIKEKQKLVGLTKAAWALCAIQVKADVQNALRGIPLWVKRHVDRVAASVIDKADASSPDIKLVSKLPWASKALRKNEHAEAIRISRQKFFNSMKKEIREAIKQQKVVASMGDLDDPGL
jgi:hypothetical protein